MKVYVGYAHGGFELGREIVEYLDSKDYEVEDMGAEEYDSEDDHPDYAIPVAKSVAEREIDKGILVCKTGIGMQNASGIDTRTVRGEDIELVRSARKHNDAQVLCLGSDRVAPGLAKKITDVFLETSSKGGRHERRVKKIEEYREKRLK